MHAPLPPGGCFDGTRHLFAVRVYFEDTDLSGVVYHANYLRWFERARSDMLRSAGIDQRGAHDAGNGAYAVTDMTLRYIAPARLDDAVLLVSRVIAVTPATCRLAQEAWRDDQLLCTATLRVAFVAPTGRPRRQPPAWVDAFRALIDADLSPIPSDQGPNT
ncbi:YbgC/FadM family acyl-CoA thioesterase [Novosphingobium sp.]|uniref:YbgC/FadM family acyl-CoA thioesterase n=1 Tax=Novosphingobium sp. TaxID=1874826 RepID=UPI00333E34F6